MGFSFAIWMTSRRISASTFRPPGRVAYVPFPRDELPMPPQQRIRRHDGGDFPQRPTAHPERSYRESSPVV
ncbi:MAG TPA: hypothetical protein VHI99_05565, partial [Vicinamibacterales bacterium]|nr:hypothetical protein [Vicinamibacterales bacterium]